MKKYLLFVVLFFSCLSIQAQDENEALVSIAKMNWVGVSELPSWCYFSGDNDSSLEFVDDGINIIGDGHVLIGCGWVVGSS